MGEIVADVYDVKTSYTSATIPTVSAGENIAGLLLEGEKSQ
jgi:hypothetical protein